VYVCISYTTRSLCGAAFAMCCWPIRSFRAESHAAHRVLSLSLFPTFSPLSHHASAFSPGPSGPSPPPASSAAATAALRPTVPLRPNSASFLRPLRPQAGSPGRLTELTVSTAGWLAGFAGAATQPATFLFSRVCAATRPGFTWRYLPACSLSSLTSLRATGSESSRCPRALALDFKSLFSRTCLPFLRVCTHVIAQLFFFVFVLDSSLLLLHPFLRLPSFPVSFLFRVRVVRTRIYVDII